jgi:hypothetical protein
MSLHVAKSLMQQTEFQIKLGQHIAKLRKQKNLRK